MRNSTIIAFFSLVTNVMACNETTSTNNTVPKTDGLSVSSKPAAKFFVTYISNDGSGVKVVETPPPAPTVHPEFLGAKQEIGVPGLTLPPKERMSRELADLLSSSKNSTDATRVFITAVDVPFDWHTLAVAASTEAHESRVSARREQVKNHLQPIASLVKDLGGEVYSTAWLVPSMGAVLPLSTIHKLIELPDITFVELDEGQPTIPNAPYTGQELRSSIKLNDFIYQGYDGSAGGRSGGRIKLGILEGTSSVSYHPGLIGTRFHTFSCDSFGCAEGPITNSDSHATSVARIAAGTIENGEDPAITNPTERIQRSGAAPKAELWVGGATPACTAKANSFDFAIAQQFDICNMSYFWSGACSPTTDTCSTASRLRNMALANTLPVIAVGNMGDGGGSTCTATYPAIRRDGIAVGAAYTPNTATNFDTATIAGASSRGGMDLAIGGTTYTKAASVVDIIAPGGYDLWYGGPSAYGYYTAASNSACCFTSWATPAVSGAAALLHHARSAVGAPPRSAYEQIAQIIMLGDHWSYDQGSVQSSQLDRRSGAGRLHMHYPSNNSLTAPWGWLTTRNGIATAGTSISFVLNGGSPLPSNVTQLKVGMTTEEDDYMAASDLDVFVENTCPSGGGTTILNYDFSRDIRSKVTVTSGLSGACVRVRVLAYYLPSARNFALAAMWHSGTAD